MFLIKRKLRYPQVWKKIRSLAKFINEKQWLREALKREEQSTERYRTKVAGSEDKYVMTNCSICNRSDIIKSLKSRQLRWIGHLVKIEKKRTPFRSWCLTSIKRGQWVGQIVGLVNNIECDVGVLGWEYKQYGPQKDWMEWWNVLKALDFLVWCGQWIS